LATKSALGPLSKREILHALRNERRRGRPEELIGSRPVAMSTARTCSKLDRRSLLGNSVPLFCCISLTEIIADARTVIGGDGPIVKEISQP
jgi:hypothetical protein